jgi:hypothetical protein
MSLRPTLRITPAWFGIRNYLPSGLKDHNYYFPLSLSHTRARARARTHTHTHTHTQKHKNKWQNNNVADFDFLSADSLSWLWLVVSVISLTQRWDRAISFHSLPCHQSDSFHPWTVYIRGPFEKSVDWRQCAAVMQREAVTVMPSCSGGGNVVVAWSSSL